MDKKELPAHLRKSVLLGIQQEERRRARIYLVGSFITALSSAVGLIFSVKYLIQSLYQSGFYNYLYLFFSDPDVATAYWRELSLSLMETTPLFEITISLVAVAVLMASVRVFAVNTRKFQLSFAN